MSFDSISAKHCLILLGEPGMGKTTTLKHYYEIIYKKLDEKETALWFELREFDSVGYMAETIFKNPTFRSFLTGTQNLYLFLDGLDECKIRIDAFATLLSRKVEQCDKERLFLRISCRNFEWPETLEHVLRKIWKNDNEVSVFELAPLRRADVIEAAHSNQFDPNVFLDEIDNKNVVPLAIRPVTLKFLLNEFEDTNTLSSNRKDLYLKGCLWLV